MITGDPILDHGADPRFGAGTDYQSKFHGKRGKKDKKDKKKKKKKHKSGHRSDSGEDGEDARAFPGYKKRFQDFKQKQLQLDVSITENERLAAIDGFLAKTGFDHNQESDARTAEQLRKMRDEETEKEMQKLQNKYKRMREIKESKKIKEEQKREFIKQIEDTAIAAS